MRNHLLGSAKQFLKETACLKQLRAFRARMIQKRFYSSDYWEKRYQKGQTSGAGSYGQLAVFKADFLNDFANKNNIQCVAELGCGDGAQAELFNFPQYIGMDIAQTSVDICNQKFSNKKNKTFLHINNIEDVKETYPVDLAISLDVIYHLTENAVFSNYMENLFSISRSYVIVYSSNHENNDETLVHVKHRKFTDWITENHPEWALHSHTPNPYPYDPVDENNTSFSDFFVFKKLRD